MLDGKVGVVTGAGRGLGRAYARALASAGAAVVVNDLDADVAEDTVAAIVAAGGAAVAEVGPVGGADIAQRLVDRAVEEFGRLDVMVTNAGALRDKSLRNTTDEDFDLVVGSHLRGTFTCGRAAAARFREQGEGGRLILVGSPAGQRASFGQTAYSASKGAIVAMMRTWAVECQKIGVTVNALVPTALTRMVATIPGLGELVAAVEAGEPVPEKVRSRASAPRTTWPRSWSTSPRTPPRESPVRPSPWAGTGLRCGRIPPRWPSSSGPGAGTPTASPTSSRARSRTSSRITRLRHWTSSDVPDPSVEELLMTATVVNGVEGVRPCRSARRSGPATGWRSPRRW